IGAARPRIHGATTSAVARTSSSPHPTSAPTSSASGPSGPPPTVTWPSALTEVTVTRAVNAASAPTMAANGVPFMADSDQARIPASSNAEALPPSSVGVNTDAGLVTLLQLPALIAQAKAAQQIADDSAEEAKSLRDLADGLWVQRGRALVSKGDGWEPPSSLKSVVEQATALTATVDAETRRLQSIQSEPHAGISGLVGRVSSWNASRQVSAERSKTVAQLDPVLAQIGRQSPSPTTGDADVLA